MYKTKGFFVITFKRPEREVTIPKEENVAPLTDIQKAILQLMRDNSKITFAAMAETLGISKVTVNKHVNELKEKGLLVRKGSKSIGEWIIL
jgi:predicted HTH transcriptional regulator